MTTVSHPFAVGELGDVPLPSAPLVRTIAQIRFPHLTQFTVNEDVIASSVAAALADQYPLMEVGQEVSVTITAEGVSENRSPTRLWRLTSGDRAWQVSFSGAFLSIETTSYGHRSDFARRLSEAWKALNQHVAVPYIDRLGVRYVNQLSDREHLDRLPELIRPEVLGVAVTEAQGETVLASALSEAQYRFPRNEGSFHARWGLLPAGTRIDEAGPVRDYATWILDMDSFQEWPPTVQGGKDVYDEVCSLALRGYQFFRWAVTPEFLAAFGGES